MYVPGISLSTLRRRIRREAHVLEAQVNTPALCLLATETERSRECEIKENKERDG